VWTCAWFLHTYLSRPFGFRDHQALKRWIQNIIDSWFPYAFNAKNHLEVTLVSVHHHRFVPVVLAHHLDHDATDRRLEVSLLRVDHQTDVLVECAASELVDSPQHPFHLRFFLVAEAWQQRLYGSGLSENGKVFLCRCCVPWKPEILSFGKVLSLMRPRMAPVICFCCCSFKPRVPNLSMAA